MYFFVFLIILTVATRIPFLNREFVLEEALNVKDAIAISQNGYPQVYAGEQSPSYIHLDRPPGLFLALAASFKIFGVSEPTARSVPLVFFIGQLLLIIHYGFRLFPKQRLTVFLAALLFTTSPYIIQNSTHIHYDGAIFSFFSTWFLLAALLKIISKKNSANDHCQLALILFFAFATKYEPTLMAIFTVMIFSFFKWRPFFPKLALASLISAALFFAIFFLYNLSFSHPEAFFKSLTWINHVLTTKFVPQVTSVDFEKTRSLWASNYYLAIRFLSWLGIPLILLSIFAFVRVLSQKATKRDPRILFLLIWFFVFCSSYLILGWAGDFPRYFAPAMPALFLLIGTAFSYDRQRFSEISARTVLVALSISALVFFLFVQNQLLFQGRITGWNPNLQIPFFVTLFLTAALTIVASRFKKIIIPTYLFLISLNFFQTATQYVHDLKSDYSLTNFYGYGAYRDSGKFLKDQFYGKNGTILTFDPVAYYWEGYYLDYALFGYWGDYTIIISYLQNDKISAIALPRPYLEDLEKTAKNYDFDYQKYISDNFKNYKNIGGEKGIEIFY